jgi:hypothetical protein
MHEISKIETGRKGTTNPLHLEVCNGEMNIFFLGRHIPSVRSYSAVYEMCKEIGQDRILKVIIESQSPPRSEIIHITEL